MLSLLKFVLVFESFVCRMIITICFIVLCDFDLFIYVFFFYSDHIFVVFEIGHKMLTIKNKSQIMSEICIWFIKCLMIKNEFNDY